VIDLSRVDSFRSALHLGVRIDRGGGWAGNSSSSLSSNKPSSGSRRIEILRERGRKKRFLYYWDTVQNVQNVQKSPEKARPAVGLDGFNLLPCPTSVGLDDICDLLSAINLALASHGREGLDA
jgi:hypothetical protein